MGKKADRLVDFLKFYMVKEIQGQQIDKKLDKQYMIPSVNGAI